MAADALDRIDPGLGPDLSVVARQVVDAKRRLRKDTPSAVELAGALTELTLADTIKGSSTLTLTIADPDYELRDSGFFDADRDGKLDRIDLNYPEGSRFWWRLTQVGIQDTWSVDMVFMERAAVYMMGHFGPLKASRAKKTRAEFIKSLADKVKAGGGITFHSRELHKTQPVAGDPKPKKEEQRKVDKGPGINPGAKILIKGHEADRKQKRRVEIALDVATELNAPELAVKAMLCAGIGESDFTNVVNSIGFGGAFQGAVSTTIHPENWFASMDDEERTAAEAHSFLKGGRGYGAGAIALANAHTDWSPGKIATTIEGSGQPPSFYEHDAQGHNYIHEAELMLDAYGGASSFTGTVYRKQFNFEVGSADDPHEDFWDAANRLAEDVRWPLFLNGNDLYFDSELTLIRQKPAAVIERDSASVVGEPQGTWDARHIATEVTLDLVCDPLEFRAGEVVQLVGYGPFSTGSTAKLPGRWLIEQIDRKRSEVFSSFTLKQPEKPRREPTAGTGERSDPAESGGDISGTPKDVIDNVVLPIAADCGVRLTPLQVTQANAAHTHLGSASDHAGPPDHAWAVDMGIGPDIRGGGNKAGADKGDKIAKALQRKFDMPDYKGGVISKQATFGGKRYRFQLIWRYEDAQAGNHFTHVHFGVRRIGKFDDSGSPKRVAKGGAFFKGTDDRVYYAVDVGTWYLATQRGMVAKASAPVSSTDHPIATPKWVNYEVLES